MENTYISTSEGPLPASSGKSKVSSNLAIISSSEVFILPSRSFDVLISYGTLHLIVAELTSEGLKKFHSFSNFKAVDLDWLEREKSVGNFFKSSEWIL